MKDLDSANGEDTALTASLTLVRPTPKGPELFWAKRSPERDFLGGFHAFFAGSVESEDAELPADSANTPDAALRAAALRECMEECGVLFTTGGLRRLQGDERHHSEVITHREPLATSRLQHLGWWKTPQWMTPDFITVFYALFLTEAEGRRLDDLSEHLDESEFETGRWLTAAEALHQWNSAEALTTSPIRAIIEAFRGLAPNADSLPGTPPLGSSQDMPGTSQTIEICGGVVLTPLETATLPPATHTNTLVVGRQSFVVIDPGAADRSSLRPLIEVLQQRLDKGHRCKGVVLTHHHRDHIGGIKALSELLSAPLLAHPETVERIGDSPLPVRHLDDGDELPIDHPGPLVSLHTPGHAPGHLAFHQPATGLLIAGDLVASKGTIIVNPPEGKMGDYLRSLRRVRDLNPALLLPAHGPPVVEARKLIEHYLAHRQMREDKVLDALHEMGPATSAELVPRAYDDAPESVWPLAERSLLAHLHHLVEQGIARQENAQFEVR